MCAPWGCLLAARLPSYEIHTHALRSTQVSRWYEGLCDYFSKGSRTHELDDFSLAMFRAIRQIPKIDKDGATEAVSFSSCYGNT